jgi:hippurate hydrolase
MLASADKLGAMISGKGGHAAMPHDAVDPVPIACEAVIALQSFIARRTTFTDPAILSVTKISAGSTHNVIPDDVELLGTMRTLSNKTRQAVGEAFERIITKIAEAHGATAGAWIEEGYPPTMNDPRAVALVRDLVTEQFGEDAYFDMPAPIMGAEDFSYVLQKVPGAMAFLGVAPPDGDAAARAPLHNPSMMVDEDVLPRGVAMHCAFATRFLERGWE